MLTSQDHRINLNFQENSNMKKSILVLLGLVLSISGFSQKFWYETEGALMDEEITLFVDISKCDNQSIVDEGKIGLDMYIWTWSPAEHGQGHKYVNGVGTQAWKSSNPELKMTRVDPTDLTSTVFSYTMIPTEFYEVDIKDVYDNDIKMLVKPEDGGGYGDPDYKTEDLELGLEAPKSEALLVGAFPSVPFLDDVFSVIYDNNLETESALLNLGEDEAYVYAAAWDSTSATAAKADYEVTNYFTASRNPDLKMTYTGDGKFQFTIIPNEFFGITTGVVNRMKFIVVKKDKTDRTAKDLDVVINCWK